MMMASPARVSRPISKSHIYGVRTKKRLAEVLDTDLPTLKHLQNLGDSAYILRVCRPKPGKKPRQVQDPIPELKAIHKRLNRLLQRVAHPAYVQAGLKGLSYKTNAENHPHHEWVCTIDVQSFYPSCKRERIYQFFKQTLNCSPDVADILADLNTVNGHLPTGGPFSLLLSYWSHLDIFEKIHKSAEKHELKMTLYVDDLTFSGKRARRSFLNSQVKPILWEAGLVGHKIKSYSPITPKHITVVVRTEAGSKVPFSRARKIRDAFELLAKATSPEDKLVLMTQLVSRLSEAAQIDSSFQKGADAMRDCRRNLLNMHPELKLT
jgi:RNA-directed DNA polymerase